MKKYLVLFALVFTAMLNAQNADFETTGFEIRPIAMNTAEKSLLAYNLEEDTIPSMFTLESLSGTLSQVNNTSMIYVPQEPFANKNNTKAIKVLKAPTLNADQVYAFTNDGSISGVKNIAYKRASGGNIADAYCNALYAARAENGN